MGKPVMEFTNGYVAKAILILAVQLCFLSIQSCGQSDNPSFENDANPSTVLGNSSDDESQPPISTPTPETSNPKPPATETPPPEKPPVRTPIGVNLNTESLFRTKQFSFGDNWPLTWTADGNQMTSMSDGALVPEGRTFHNMTYYIKGEADDFTYSKVLGYPEFLFGTPEFEHPGWYGYGIIAIDETIYSMVSKVPESSFYGPFLGVKMLKSTDNGASWYRVNRNGETRLIAATDFDGSHSVDVEDMFFWKEFGREINQRTYYPFSFLAFVQNGQAGRASPDGYIYIYSPEGARSNQLLLARVKKESFEQRDNWEYFKQWEGDTPVWSKAISERGNVMVFPEKNSNGDSFGWYSWLPSVVWNEGLGVYIMVNGGTYTFNYDWNNLDLSGSLGFWYSKTPFGPWEQIYYTDHFTVDDPKNRLYQPKLSPKWISEDGEEMVLIWSDAMANEQGLSHSVNYRWNQMKINLEIAGNQTPSAFAGEDQSIEFKTTTGSNQVFLNGIIGDDGLPAGSSLNSQWTQLEGPGSVIFENASQPQTVVSFEQKGSYQLQLKVTDGELSRSDNILILVQ